MKKYFSVIFIILSSLVFTACSDAKIIEEPVINKQDESFSDEQEEAGQNIQKESIQDIQDEYTDKNKENDMNVEQLIKIVANDVEMYAVLSDNSSAEAFKELLSNGALTINMSDYGSFEKVGDIGANLPRNDEQITTEPGDIILYLGNKITIYYDTNSWNFTRLGKITKIQDDQNIKDVLGKGDVTVQFSLVD